MQPADITAVRSFSRTVTQQIGALNDAFLSRDRSLRLGLDAGYLSRVLSSLADEGLVTMAPDSADRRVRAVRLTRRSTGCSGRVHGEPVGCAALKLHGDDTPAEVKRMWVDEAARGLGLGRRLLAAVEEHARHHHAPALRLDTNASLTEVITLYRSAGYREVPALNDEPFADHWFHKRLDPPA